MLKKLFFGLFLGIFLVFFLGVNSVFAIACVCCDCGPGVGNCSPLAGPCEADEECQGDTNPGDGVLDGKCVDPTTITVCSGSCDPEVGSIVETIFNFIFWLGMAIFPLMAVAAGILFMTASGDPQRIERAKKILFASIIGLVLFVSARGITAFIRYLIGA